MNKYVINTKDYNTVIPRKQNIPKDLPIYNAPSTFYDFAAPKTVRIVGYDSNLHSPTELIEAMRKACENL